MFRLSSSRTRMSPAKCRYASTPRRTTTEGPVRKFKDPVERQNARARGYDGHAVGGASGTFRPWPNLCRAARSAGGGALASADICGPFHDCFGSDSALEHLTKRLN